MAGKEKNYLKDIGKYTSFSFIGEIARYLFLIIGSAIVTNFFGAEIFGKYSYIISFITILIVVSGIGLGSGVIYFGQKYRQNNTPDKAKGVIAFAYATVAVSGGIITAAVMIFAEPISRILLNSPEHARLLRLMAPLIVIEALYILSLDVFRSLKRIARFSLIRNIFYHVLRITAILLCFTIFGMKDVTGIVIPTYTAYLSVLIYSLVNLHKSKAIGKASSVSRPEKREILKYSLPLFMSSIISILLRHADILMLGFLRTEEAVAVYKISVQICGIIPFLKHITANFFSPMISSLYHSGKRDEMIHTYQKITKWSFTIGLMVFLGIVLFGDSILHIFGRSFVYGHKALILVACGSIIGVVTGQTGSMNAMTGHSRFNLVSAVTTFVINIVLNVILIPLYGIVGAAIATLISAVIGNSMSLIYLYIKQRIHPYDITYIKPFIAGGISYVVIYLLNHLIMWDGVTDILIKGTIFVILFIGSILILKIDGDDKIILNGMLNSIYGLFRRKR